MNPEASWALPLHAHDSLWLPSSFRFFFLHWIINSVRETPYLSFIHRLIPRAIWSTLPDNYSINELRGCHWRHLRLFTCRWLISPEIKEDSVPFCRLFPSLPYTQLLQKWLGFTLGTLRKDQWPYHRGAFLAACLDNFSAWVPSAVSLSWVESKNLEGVSPNSDVRLGHVWAALRERETLVYYMFSEIHLTLHPKTKFSGWK